MSLSRDPWCDTGTAVASGVHERYVHVSQIHIRYSNLYSILSLSSFQRPFFLLYVFHQGWIQHIAAMHSVKMKL